MAYVVNTKGAAYEFGTDTFGQLVKDRRQQLDLTQEELAIYVNCTTISDRRIEGGPLRPSRPGGHQLYYRTGLNGFILLFITFPALLLIFLAPALFQLLRSGVFKPK
jgi:hypothetical protein